ncbi:EF-hand domain-containing protein [Actinomadura sp. 1N219]|uniref:EF-hand domain-containing protein n=1 Tax=Actinomadura sp. 1N219 TaxID=3375152 RepID=UPI0037956E7E
MASSLQEENIKAAFDLLDTDGNGVLERQDFDLKAEKARKEFALVAGSPKHRNLQVAYTAWWERIRAAADVNEDGRVTREEFVTSVINGMLSDPDYFDTTIGGFARALFEAADDAGTGAIGQGQFVRIFGTVGIPADAAEAAFAAYGASTIDLDTFVTAARDAYGSNDPDAPGTATFGRR